MQQVSQKEGTLSTLYQKGLGKKTLCQKQITNLLKQAQLLNLPKRIIAEAQDVLRDTMGAAATAAHASSNARRTSVFMDKRHSDEQLAIAMQTFGDIYNYPKLRERQPVLDKFGRDLFLEHTKQRLRAPLTYTVPEKHIGTVSQCFRNILGWMNDRRYRTPSARFWLLPSSRSREMSRPCVTRSTCR